MNDSRALTKKDHIDTYSNLLIATFEQLLRYARYECEEECNCISENLARLVKEGKDSTARNLIEAASEEEKSLFLYFSVEDEHKSAILDLFKFGNLADNDFNKVRLLATGDYKFFMKVAENEQWYIDWFPMVDCCPEAGEAGLRCLVEFAKENPLREEYVMDVCDYLVSLENECGPLLTEDFLRNMDFDWRDFLFALKQHHGTSDIFWTPVCQEFTLATRHRFSVWERDLLHNVVVGLSGANLHALVVDEIFGWLCCGHEQITPSPVVRARAIRNAHQKN